jgi:trehalose 6-phosphate phosphatase
MTTRRRSRRPAAPGSRLWARITAARHRLLMLDYDGTLAPLRVRREEALPTPGILDTLSILGRDRGTTLAVVTGRPLRELTALLGHLRAVRVAEHGWEVRWPDGRHLVHAVPRATARLLAEAAEAAETRIRAGTIERKRTAVVLHTRGLSRATARVTEIACRALWAGFAERHGLRLDPIDGGIEIRARGRDKGDVVRWLLRTSPRGTLPVYIGDDSTDEDAFRALGPRGITIRVGPPARPTAARMRLESPESVVDFLDEWVTRVPRVRPAARGHR